MNPLLRDMPLFVEVARLKSFTLAAEKLDMYVSTLSRRIAALEKEMGVPLFLRNTRNVELTTGGNLLLERCEFILEETDNAWEAVVGNMTAPSGPVRVSMYEYTYHAMLKGVFSDFVTKWPGIQLSINFNERSVDLFTEPYDVDFRSGPLADSSLMARKILTIEPRLYASPTFLERYPAPLHPRDLTAAPCICLTRIGNVWTLHKGKERVDVALRPAYSFGSISLCYEFALAGHGVAMLRKHLAENDVQEGRLVRILPGWTGVLHDVFMVTAPGQTPRRIKVFVDYMMDFFARVPN